MASGQGPSGSAPHVGKLYGGKDDPRVKSVLVSASYSGVQIDVNEADDQAIAKQFGLAKAPAFESSDGVKLTETGAIAYYVASQQEGTQLLGTDKKQTAQVLQYILFVDNEIVPYVKTWLDPILGKANFNKPAHSQAVDNLKKSLAVLDGVLLKQTYLVGERVTLADITVASALNQAFKMVLDKDFRKNIKNLTRWYTTIINKEAVKKVLGEASLSDKAQVWVAPKKEKKEKEVKPKAAPKEAAKDEPKAEEDEPAPPPKPKSKLDLLPPAKMVLDEWKRTYSNNDTHSVAWPWFVEHFDPEGYSVWHVNYKYNDELKQVFMSANLIGGFFNRLERARKYAFGSMCVLGQDNKNEIAGYFIIRGQEIPEEVSDAADFPSFNFTKVDWNDKKAREPMKAYFAWDDVIEGKKFADGKVFK